MGNEGQDQTNQNEINSEEAQLEIKSILQSFSMHDLDHLSTNEYHRYYKNSKKVGHALLSQDAQGLTIAEQHLAPIGIGEETPEVRSLENIESIRRFGKEFYRANTPNGTAMHAKRFVDMEIDDQNNDNQAIRKRLACFSPAQQSEFWPGIGKKQPVFSDDTSNEVGLITKGGEPMEVVHADVLVRDGQKRKPLQNAVMKMSAKEAYKDFLHDKADKLSDDLKERLKRAISVKLGNNHRPEWLHAKGFGLTPLSQDPQVKENLGAAPKWANTEMMVLERVIKWFAVNRPSSKLAINPLFEMLSDSELIERIEFQVTVEDNNKLVTMNQDIDPFIKFPTFRKASDIAQTTLVVNNEIYGISPINTQEVMREGTRDLLHEYQQRKTLASTNPTASDVMVIESNNRKRRFVEVSDGNGSEGSKRCKYDSP